MLSQVTHGFRAKHTTNPRTVLGFFAIVLGLVLTAGVGTIAALAASGTSTYLIPWILTFCAALIVLITLGVYLVAKSDPSKLLLTQVTGTEYAAIQQRTVVGDSHSGERPEVIGTEIAALTTVPDSHSLPKADADRVESSNDD